MSMAECVQLGVERTALAMANMAADIEIAELQALVQEALPTVDAAGTLIVTPYTSLIDARDKWADWLARARALLGEKGLRSDSHD